MPGTRFLSTAAGLLAITGSNVVNPGGAPSQPVAVGWVVMDSPNGTFETIPNWCEAETTVDATGERIESAGSGNWESGATWVGGQVPSQNAIVVVLDTHTVTLNTQLADTYTFAAVILDEGGTLTFSRAANTSLKACMFMPCPGSTWDQGTVANPINNVTSTIIFANVAIDTATDPDRWSNGFIAHDAIVRIHGKVKTTFLRTSVEPEEGDSTVALASTPTAWAASDRLIMPDTRQLNKTTETGVSYVPQWEIMAFASNSSNTITLSTPLAHDHLGAYEEDLTLTFLPHVANTTRNIVFKSESAAGVRGHFAVMGRSDVDIRYAEFQGLGRSGLALTSSTSYAVDNRQPNGHANAAGGTSNGSGGFTVGTLGSNQIGRYPLHVHHLLGPVTPQSNGITTAELASGPQFTLIGNAVHTLESPNSRKWGIVVHDSSYGYIAGNVVDNCAGSGIFLEDGSEVENVIDGNFVMRAYDHTGAPRLTWGRGDENGFDVGNLGNEGVGLWFRGFKNYVRNNVSANCGSYNYTYFAVNVRAGGQAPGYVVPPSAQGSDSTVAINMHATPISQFLNNEGYGATPSMMTLWWLGTLGDVAQTIAESVMEDNKVWHHHQQGIFFYETNNLRLDGHIGRNKGYIDQTIGLWPGDYFCKNMVVENADIQGYGFGYASGTKTGGGTQTIRDSFLCNYWNTGSGLMVGSVPVDISPRLVVCDNCTFATPAIAADGRGAKYNIRIATEESITESVQCNIIVLDEFVVTDYNGDAGDDFQVYYLEQAPAHILLPTLNGGATRVGSPDTGRTNAQNWADHGIAWARAVSPTAATRAGILGFVEDT